MYKLIFFLLIIFSSVSFSQNFDESEIEDSDFQSPGQNIEEDEEECKLSPDSDLIKLLNLKLRKFNPMAKELEDQPPLSDEEVKQKSVRFYANQLEEANPVYMDIDKFVTLGGATLSSLINRSSKVFLKHPEKCEFFSLYGDQIIGYYEIPYNRILRLYASAVNKENNIAQDFIRSQVVPAPMNLDAAISLLYDDYGYQQNIIESLLPDEVRSLFFGEGSQVSIADVAESKLLAFSVLGGKVSQALGNEIFIIVPYSKKGLLGSNETIIITSSARIYEVPLLNVPLALNVLRSLGFNAKVIIVDHVYIDELSYCKVGEGGLWYHFKGNSKKVGCDFLSNTVRSVKTDLLQKSESYSLFKESIERVREIVNK